MSEEILKKLYIIKQLSDNKPLEYNIVTCLDNRLVDVLYVLIASAAYNLKKPTNFWILQSDFSKEQKIALETFAKKINIKVNIIEIIEADFSIFKEYMEAQIYPIQSLYYLLSHLYLPQEINRVLYIDPDTLINKDIESFYNTDFEDTWLAGMVDYDEHSAMYKIDMLAGKTPHIFRRVHNNETLINAGVLLLNLDKFRKENITIKNFFDITKPEIDKVINLGEQTIINRFVGLDLKIYPAYYYDCFAPRKDLYPSYFSKKEGVNEAYKYNELDESKALTIIHYVTCIKPWTALIDINNKYEMEFITSSKALIELYELWWKYASMIPLPILNKLIVNSVKLNSERKFNKEIKKIRDFHTKIENYPDWNSFSKKINFPSNIMSVIDPISKSYVCFQSDSIRYSFERTEGVKLTINLDNLMESDIQYILNRLKIFQNIDLKEYNNEIQICCEYSSESEIKNTFCNIYSELSNICLHLNKVKQNFHKIFLNVSTNHDTFIFYNDGKIQASKEPSWFNRILFYYVKEDNISLYIPSENSYIMNIEENGVCTLCSNPKCFPCIFIAKDKFSIRIGDKYLSTSPAGFCSLAPHIQSWENFKILNPSNIFQYIN